VAPQRQIVKDAFDRFPFRFVETESRVYVSVRGRMRGMRGPHARACRCFNSSSYYYYYYYYYYCCCYCCCSRRVSKIGCSV